MTETPSGRERRALEHLRSHETIHALSGVGTTTIRDMLRKEWIEPSDPIFNIGERYRLTDAGKAALNARVVANGKMK